MPVEIQSPSGQQAVNSFSDTLQTSDPNSGSAIGQKWIQGILSSSPVVEPVGGVSASIGNSSQDGAGAFLFNVIGSTTTFWNSYFLPIPTLVTVFGKTQFSQVTMVKAGSGVRAGPGVCVYYADSGGITCYGFNNFNNTSWQLIRWNAGTGTVLTSGTTGLANGDIYRLSADLSVGGQVGLTVLKNGISFTTFTDSSASRITIGSPGLVCTGGIGSGTDQDFRTFSCGIGT